MEQSPFHDRHPVPRKHNISLAATDEPLLLSQRTAFLAFQDQSRLSALRLPALAAGKHWHSSQLSVSDQLSALLPQTQQTVSSQSIPLRSPAHPPGQFPLTQQAVSRSLPPPPDSGQELLQQTQHAVSTQPLPPSGPGPPPAQFPPTQQALSMISLPLSTSGQELLQQTQHAVSTQPLPPSGPGPPPAQCPPTQEAVSMISLPPPDSGQEMLHQTQHAVSTQPLPLHGPGHPAGLALQAVGELQTLFDTLASRDNISLPDIAAAVCCATNRATLPGITPAPIGRSDDPRSVFANSPFRPCPPGQWSVGRLAGAPHAGSTCSCGVLNCVGRGHFPVINATNIYDMHVEFVCDSHRCDQSGNFVTPQAHASCYIHTLCTLLSGVWVPFKDGQEPTVQQRAHPAITIDPDSVMGKAATAAIQDGLSRHFFELVANPDDFSECAIIESGFIILKGKLSQSPVEAAVLSNPQADPRQVAVLAKQRATTFASALRHSTPTRSSISQARAQFTQTWHFCGGATKCRLCVAHDVILNPLCHPWSLRYMQASAFLETAEPGDVGITTDHVSGYSGVLIHPDFRRFFCFTHPCTGAVYRSTRLDFGWLLSPGIFSFFTAEVNAILKARLQLLSTRSFSGYYIDDNIVRIPGSTRIDTNGLRSPSELEHKTAAVLADVSKRAGFLTAPQKRMWGPIVVFVGLTLDPARRSATLVPEKLFKILTMLFVVLIVSSDILTTRHVPPVFFKRVIGGLQWLAGNVAGGSLYTAPIWLASHLLDIGKIQSVQACTDALSCLIWWAESAIAGSLKPHVFVRGIDLPSLRLAFSPSAATGAEAALFTAAQRAGSTRTLLSLLSDTSGTRGWGAVWSSSKSFLRYATYAALTVKQREWLSIAPKELLAWTLWIEFFGHEYVGALILLGTDNIGNVHCTNRRRIRADDTLSRSLLLRLVKAAALHSIDLIAWWCPRELNGIADGLSKSLDIASARRISTAHGLTFREQPPSLDTESLGVGSASTQ